MKYEKDSTKSRCLFVLGMHRSGTSTCMGILHILGVDIGNNLLSPNPNNPKGFFEDRTIVELNDKILKALHSAWDDDRPLPVNWHKKKEICHLKYALKNHIRTCCTNKPLHGFKDPRIGVLLPLYLDILRELSVEPLFVVMLRKDIEVIRSLQKRNNFSVIKAQNLFEKYTAGIAAYTKKEKSVYVDFDDLLRNPAETIEKIRNGLELTVGTYEEKREEIDNFIDPMLKHHTLSYTSFLKEVDEDLQANIHRLEQREKQIASLNDALFVMRGNTLVRCARRIETPLLRSLRRHPVAYKIAGEILRTLRRIAGKISGRPTNNTHSVKRFSDLG